jgi:protein arginine kinase activator
MLCEECKLKEATVHYQEIVDGNYSEVHLCEECAKKKGLDIVSILPSMGLANLIAGLAEIDIEALPQKGGKECEVCGLTYLEFKDKGRVGCSHCYEAFEPQMRHILRKIHGNIQHTGKLVSKGIDEAEIVSLKRELEQAVAKEEFERAAKLRDRIRALERKKEDGA